MWHIAIASDLVGCIDDDDALVVVVRQNPGDFAKHCCFADARPTYQQNALTRLDQIVDQPDAAKHGAANPASQANRFAGAITNDRDAVECAFDTGSVVITGMSDVIDYMGDLRLADLFISEPDISVREPGFR